MLQIADIMVLQWPYSTDCGWIRAPPPTWCVVDKDIMLVTTAGFRQM